MSIKFDKVQPGMTLWKTERRRMGNTTMRETVAIAYSVLSVNVTARSVCVSSNGNQFTVSERRLTSFRASDPTCKECRRVGGHIWTCSKSRRKTEGK